jgi:putative transposase
MTQLPRIGRVRIAPGERGYAPSGSYAQVSLVQEQGRWFASVVLEQAAVVPIASQSPAEVGIDLGVRKLANMTRSAKGTLSAPGKRVRQKAGLNRAVLDAAFARFRRQLEYKLAWRGGRVVLVPPAYTSQRCLCCGAFNNPDSSEIYACAACGLRIDRDLNAARNILAAASCTEAQNARGAGVRPARRSSPSGRSALKREQRRIVASHY